MLKFHEHVVLGAIFDMDGTMFDTERLRFQTLKQASQELIGQSFSNAYLMACLGLSATTAHELAQETYGADIPYAAIRKRADELELESVRSYGVPIKKGLVQVLERLRKSGLRMAVATSSRRAIAEEYLINANVYKFFDVVVCGDEVEKGKPHPEIFLTAAEKLNLNADQCLMFEDSENGVTSAFEAKGITVLFKDIKPANANMRDKANYYYENMYDYLEDLDGYIAKQDLPQLQESFPQTLNQLTVGIHGFGAIGGGYLAQILSHWDGYTRPKRIVASTRNALFREAVNAFGGYCIRYGQISYDESIQNMTVIDADDEAQMTDMYVESSLIAVCLPENALVHEVKMIAKGLYERHTHQSGQATEPLTVLIILNKVNAKQLFLDYLRQALNDLTSVAITEQILQQHYFCDTVVNRMVSKLNQKNLYRQLKIKYNIFKQFQEEVENENADLDESIQLDSTQEHQAAVYIEDLRRNFQPSHILQSMDLILFHAELDMPIYVENQSPLLSKMRQMVLVDDISEIQLIKNRLWNGTHAMMAWYASLLGHETIGIAMGDVQLQQFSQQLLAQVKQGLLLQLPHREADLNRLTQSFIDSCKFAFKDPCSRVARDPLRKLESSERVLSSVQQLIVNGQAYDQLIAGAVLGYGYAILHEQIAIDDVMSTMQNEVEKMLLSIPQQQALLMQLKRGLADLLQHPDQFDPKRISIHSSDTSAVCA
ncbi:bifunctional mannitol-1-phosphate dehydrogenase/phosphatase [Acinetobacter sp. ANC 4178]|uniref:bifunctional mannitol-1-phosphate dehydrogenase/phosphatase n=1 Tax=Acinetobacter sp. ANC 4178 TaxID=2529839 RepID=UPI001039C555|nr:HAD-IA family hydrolase [Acinetobacter sp. ANC 4178]TCB66429.1 HAD family hydrolase [Acinetobacter sp. ANC 4178]